MSRRILIEKIEESTKVTTWNTAKPLKKRMYLYNLGANVSLGNGVITVVDKGNKFPDLQFVFEELEDPLGATDLETYIDTIAANLFFLVAGEGAGGATFSAPYNGNFVYSSGPQTFTVPEGTVVLNVFLNEGRLLKPGVDYTMSGLIVTIIYALEANDEIFITGLN